MTSTRSKNTPGNYSAEQRALLQEREYFMYEHAPNSRAFSTAYAGDGLLMGRIAHTELSHNATDIETFLLGVGSTNLVEPFAPVTPNLARLDSLTMMDRVQMIMPDPLAIEPFQRPLPS